jgi:hypothetical protein
MTAPFHHEPDSNLPWSEQFRIAAKRWVHADSAARMLEETKSAVLAQRIAALGDMPVSRAETEVKASPEWADFIKQMVEARTQANLEKVKMEFVRMKFAEFQSAEASARAEMRLTR